MPSTARAIGQLTSASTDRGTLAPGMRWAKASSAHRHLERCRPDRERGRAEGSALVAEIGSERFSIRRAAERGGDAVPRPVSCSSLVHRHPQGVLSDSPGVDCRAHEFIERRCYDSNSATERGTIRGVLRATGINLELIQNSTSVLRLDKGRLHPLCLVASCGPGVPIA